MHKHNAENADYFTKKSGSSRQSKQNIKAWVTDESLKTHMGNLLGLKGVVGSPVVQVMTQTPNNQSKTFQIAHKLIHTSSLLNRNAPEI